jgi:tetratricopeptide (TPR) repeat protein
MATSPEPAELPARLQQAQRLRLSGRLSDAQLIYERILEVQPEHFESLHSLGIIAGQTNHWERAAELIGKAIAINPTVAAAYSDQGVVLKALKRWDAALASFDLAIGMQADHAEAHNNRGNLLRELRQLEAALASYDRAIAIRADYAEAYYTRGVVLHDLNRLQSALDSYDKAVAIRPDYAKAYSNRGVVLEHLNRLEAALASYNRAIAIKADYAQAYSNRGNVQRELGHWQAALASCNQAIALEPNNAMAHQNRALALLVAGDFANGWRDFEWRWRNENSPIVKGIRPFPQPLWRGEEPLTGKTILLHSEQGLGDTIQFCRYARMVAELGARVILEVQSPLMNVLTGLRGVAQLVSRGDDLPDFDYHCPLMSLPLAFKTTVSSIPAPIPYLSSDDQKVLYWSYKLGERRKFRVGVVWSGGFRPQQPELWPINGRRNIPLTEFAPLKHPDIEFYSLQKGQPAESELAELVSSNWDGPRLTDLTHLLHDFADTAALMENLDLIISVDTSTAHLAGALGKPVWILNRFDTCWRWLLDRSDSPWYPTVRLYRQEKAGDWDSVIQRVAGDLHRLLNSDRPQ